MRRFLILFAVIGCSMVLAGTDSINFNKWTIRLQHVEIPDAKVEASDIDFSQPVKNLIRSLNYDGDFTVEEYLTMNPRVSRRFERNPILTRPVDTKYLSDGSVSAEYEVSITGSILKTLIPKTGGGIPLAPLSCPLCRRPWPEDLEVPEGIKLVPEEQEPIITYTGIIIDAQGLKVKPALFPKIFNEDGKEAYGIGFALENYVQDLGMVSYVRTMSEAHRSERAGLNPLRIDALRVNGRLNSDIIITNNDAIRMHQSQRNLKLLERCQVLIVIGE